MASQTIEMPREPAGGTQSRPVTDLAVTGMTCANCARHVAQAIQAVPGVQSAAVNLEANQATVRWKNGGKGDVAAVLSAVAEAGYGATVIEAGSQDQSTKLAGWGLNLAVGLPVTALLMLGEWAFGLAMTPWFQWAAFGLAGLVQVVGGARFYRGAWGQLRVGGSNMDTLVALGSTTAFGYSAWALLAGHGGHVYFMEAASIITLISLGHRMESLVSVRASGALRELLNLAPATARRRNPDGSESETSVAELQPDDLVVLRPGDRVPTDGRVTEGTSVLDESMLTGESNPVEKAPGSEVYAGTVNQSGRLLMRVTATGETTALAHIIAAVQRAQASRANIQRLGDRVSNVFVPIVVVIALGAGLWWGCAPASARAGHDLLAPWLWPAHLSAGSVALGFIVASAVLIVACPCAMGLATPAAIMAGSNAAAKRGILVRDGVALEKAGTVTAVVFDKTGTLTAGRPEVARLEKFGEDGEAGEPLAAALAGRSNHPISQAIVRKVTATGTATAPELGDSRELHGSGIQAEWKPAAKGSAGATARLGSLRWLGESGVDLRPGARFIEEWSAQAATIVGLSVGTRLAALIAVRDTLKPGAAEVVERLHAQGLKCYLLTGDNRLTAETIARQAGIASERVFAEVRPEQKAGFVERLQAAGERVAFVGDGINDGPALEQSDLGIAVSRASDVAREAADIILLKSEIEAVPESLGLARATLRTIKQNLFWAFFYNAAGIPLAALGFMSPVLCAAAMGFSDLIVIGNALRLSRWRLRA